MSPPAVAVGCPLCGPRVAAEPLLDGVLHRCVRCALQRTARPHDVAYDAAYFAAGGYDDYFRAGPRAFEARRRVRWLRSFVRAGTLLEAGCAGGFFVDAARRAGFDARGIDVSAEAVAYASQRLGVPALVGAFEAAEPSAVDIVCAFHVLEHVADPAAFLDAAARTLHPGGLLVLEVPNIDSGAARRLGTAWQALQPVHHRWHFGPRTLTALVRAHGFDVLRTDTAVFRHYMPARYRWRHARRLLPADWRDTGGPFLTHPRAGDLLRLVARRPRRKR